MFAALVAGAIVSTTAGFRIARERETAQLEAYYSAIGLANSHIKDGKIQQALEVLWKCPERYRQWEWAGCSTSVTRKSCRGRRIRTTWTNPRPQTVVTHLDYDNDGFLDLFVANTRGESDFLCHNNGNENHRLMVKLVGTVSIRSTIGAKVRPCANVQGWSAQGSRKRSKPRAFRLVFNSLSSVHNLPSRCRVSAT